MQNQWKWYLVLSLVLVSASCGKPKVNGLNGGQLSENSPVKALANPVGGANAKIEGKWTSDCLVTGFGSIGYELGISGSNLISAYYEYSDQYCDKPMFMQATYQNNVKISSVYSSTIIFDSSFQSLKYVPLNQGTVDKFNRDRTCSINWWQKDVWTEVGHTSCRNEVTVYETSKMDFQDEGKVSLDGVQYYPVK